MRKLILGGVILFVFLIPGILSFLISDIPYNSQPSFTGSEKVYKDVVLLQTFDSQVDNLSGIGVSLRNPNLKEVSDVTLRLFDDKNNLLRESIVNGKYIPDGGFIRFKFNPLQNSHNKKYEFQIVSTTPLSDNNLEVYKTEAKNGGDELIVNKKVDSQNISFVQFRKVTDHKSEVLDTYKNWWKNYISDRVFVVFYGILIVSLLGLIVYRRD